MLNEPSPSTLKQVAFQRREGVAKMTSSGECAAKVAFMIAALFMFADGRDTVCQLKWSVYILVESSGYGEVGESEGMMHATHTYLRCTTQKYPICPFWVAFVCFWMVQK